MGRRITIDSATMLNKGLEVIEACRLFDVAPSQVRVTIHPQSTVHSLVEYVDGSILAQISVTDMRLPILYALAYPERPASTLTFDLAALRHLDFEQPDFERFPCLRLAFEAAEKGGAHCIALNAADEVAVEAFLERSYSALPASRVQLKECSHPRRRRIPPPLRRCLPRTGKRVERARCIARISPATLPAGRPRSAEGINRTSMHEFLVSAAAFIVLVGVMVVVHELGHFVVAKLCGVRVEAFSFGFGPRLFGFKYGETDYKVCLLPLGGFVKMTGEEPGQNWTCRRPTPKCRKATPAPSPRIRAGSACSSAWPDRWPTFCWPWSDDLLLRLDQRSAVGRGRRPPPLSGLLPARAAAEAGIQTGDIIRRFDDVDNPAGVQVYEHIQADTPTSLFP